MVAALVFGITARVMVADSRGRGACGVFSTHPHCVRNYGPSILDIPLSVESSLACQQCRRDGVS